MKQLQFNSLSGLAFCILTVLLLPFASSCQEKIGFEKLVAHSTPCFGINCHAYHIEINADRSIRIYTDHAWSTEKAGEDDWSKMGYFTGVLPDSTYQAIVSQLPDVLQSSQDWGPELLYDVAYRELIIYHDDKRTAMASLQPPRTAYPILKLLSELAVNHQLDKTPDTFHLEHDTSLWNFYYFGPKDAEVLYEMR